MAKGTLTGLPIAAKFAEAGFKVTGIDIVEEKVDKINTGLCAIEGDESDLPELIEKDFIFRAIGR